MILPRKGREETKEDLSSLHGPFDLPALKRKVQSLQTTGILPEFVEKLQPVSIEDLEDLKRRYASLIIQLDRLRPGLAAANALTPSTDGTWSIKETLGHLIDSDRDIWWPRIEALLREEHPSFAEVDHQELVRAHDWQSQPLDDILGQCIRDRWGYAMRLNELAPDAWERSGDHEALGEICILHIVQLLVAHDEHYLAKLREMIEATAADE
ncbi:MAG TPA: DinB family protein [Candidatus Kapabacteria bacterium]|nr:DinB family protein [Candidatus Kapabacteria bacterium]